MRFIANPALAVMFLASAFGAAAPAAAGDAVAIVKPVKQGNPAMAVPDPSAKEADRPPPRSKRDPCADVHTYRTVQARAMCVAERGFPDIPDDN